MNKRSLVELKIRNKELTNRVALLSEHGKQMLTVLAGLKDALRELRKENEELKVTPVGMSARIAGLQDGLRTMGQENKELKEKIAQLSTRREEDFAWWGKVCYPDGMTAEQVQNELADFHFMLEQVPKVYMHITGGLLSKPNYFADVVIGAADGHVEACIEEAFKEVRETYTSNDVQVTVDNAPLNVESVVEEDDEIDDLFDRSEWPPPPEQKS
jgi:hypothetical protein